MAQTQREKDQELLELKEQVAELMEQNRLLAHRVESKKRAVPKRVSINVRVLPGTASMVDIMALDTGDTRQNIFDRAIANEFKRHKKNQQERERKRQKRQANNPDS